MFLVMWGLSTVLEGPPQWHFPPAFLLGAALWMTLDLRDLRAWQAETGHSLVRRGGLSPLSWTSSSAHEKLPALPSHDAP